MTLICPHLKCRSLLQVPENARGKKVRCSRCGKNFVVPQKKTSEAEKAAAQPQAG